MAKVLGTLLTAAMLASAILPAPGAWAQDEQQAAVPAKARKAKKARKSAPASTQSQEARHQVCLAFLRRHGYECDTWVQPTCGADSGYYRPPECVPPLKKQ